VKKQTARDRDRRTLERKEQCQLQAVTCESDAKRDELHRVLKSALETQVLVCADEWLSVFSDTVGRLGNEQEPEHKEPEQLTCKSDDAEETMSATVKLAKEMDEPDIDQPTAECQLMTPSEKRLVTQRDELRPVQGRAEDTDERVKTLHTEMREKSEVTSEEEGHDVERVIVPQSDEIVGILRQLKDETSADVTALEKKGLDRKTNHQDPMKTETKETVEVAKAAEAQEKAEALPRLVRPPPWRDKLQNKREGSEVEEERTAETEESQCCDLHPRAQAQGYKPRRCE